MKAKPTVLVETSIQLERIIGLIAEQRALDTHLATAAYHFVSSAYVFMEFQRAVIADYARVYHAILRHKNWNDVAHALRSGGHSYRPRTLGRCLQILTYTMQASFLEPVIALEILQTQIQHELPKRFWQHVQPITDPIHCDLVAVGVNLHTNQRFTVADRCRKEQATCHLPDFLADHRVELQAIATYLTAHPRVVKEQARLEQLIQAVIARPQAALGQSSCWPLGDIIITLQALPDTQIWTTDADFQPLAQALGLSIYTPVLDR